MLADHPAAGRRVVGEANDRRFGLALEHEIAVVGEELRHLRRRDADEADLHAARAHAVGPRRLVLVIDQRREHERDIGVGLGATGESHFMAAAREMMEILRAGETLGILVDLNTLDREGIFVDFFGRPASTTFMVAKLALRTGAAVLPVFAPWDKERGCFLLKVDPPLLIERTGNEPEDVRRLTQQYTRIVEDYVRRYPDQWLWIHRRWKTRPQDEPEIYGR